MGDAEILNKWKSGNTGKQGGGNMGSRGKELGFTQTGNLHRNKIAFAATIRAAAAHPKNQTGESAAICIEASDIRYRRFIGKERMGILFVVDASRSQGAERRLAFAKGAILALLKQVYVRRDKAGLIIFGDKKAELALPFTRSVEYAGRKLASLPAYGNTPLTMGLQKAVTTIEMEQKKDAALNPMIVLVTDGKANYDETGEPPFKSAMKMAAEIRKSGIPAVVIDTEKGVFKLGIAKQLAEQMGACYLTLE